MKEKFALSYWDAAILAAAKTLGCEAVYSEDMSEQQDYDGGLSSSPTTKPTG